MNTKEALELVLNTVEQLRLAGIKSTASMNPPDKESKKLAKKNSAEYNLPMNLWRNINFEPETSDQSAMVFAREKELLKAGIYFDTGMFLLHGSFGPIDWELDWSFSCERSIAQSN